MRFFWDRIFTWNLFSSFSIFDPSKVPPKTEPGDPKSGNESLNKSLNSTLRDPIGPKPDDESWPDKKWKRDDWKTEDERRNSAETEIVVAHFSNQPILVSLNCNYRGTMGINREMFLNVCIRYNGRLKKSFMQRNLSSRTSKRTI